MGSVKLKLKMMAHKPRRPTSRTLRRMETEEKSPKKCSSFEGSKESVCYDKSADSEYSADCQNKSAEFASLQINY